MMKINQCSRYYAGISGFKRYYNPGLMSSRDDNDQRHVNTDQRHSLLISRFLYICIHV